MVKSIRWCDTKVCVADILTKKAAPLTKAVVDILKTNIMIDLNKSEKKKVGGIMRFSYHITRTFSLMKLIPLKCFNPSTEIIIPQQAKLTVKIAMKQSEKRKYKE